MKCEFCIFGEWIFRDRIKLRILRWEESSWIIQMGAQSNVMYVYKSEAEGYFTMLRRHFKQTNKNHQEKAQRDERSGTNLTVCCLIWEFIQEGGDLTSGVFDLSCESTCRESQTFCYTLYVHTWLQRCINTNSGVIIKC